MSRVYRFDEVINLPRPSIADFATELVFARQSLHALYEEGNISGALIHGSAVTDPNPRSDIDIVVSTPNITPQTIQGVRTMTKAVHRRSGIPVDIACFTDTDLSTGRHGYFREHMLTWFGTLAARYPENVIGRSPLEITKPPQSDILTDIDHILGKTLHDFQTVYMKGVYLRPEAILEDILNFPHKAGRKTIGSLVVRDLVPLEVFDSARKNSIASAVREVFGTQDPNVIETYEAITNAASQYTAFVDRTHRGRVERQGYDAYIYELTEENLPRAIVLGQRVRTIFRSLASITDTQPTT